MSITINAEQISRPFKIEVFGLQDNFIATLQPFSFNRKGQLVSPQISIQDDGTQTFTCSIPRFYIDEETNEKRDNPRWRDTENGILAENVRVLKVFVDYGEEGIKVYPFRIDTVVKKRDANFSTYREITANGLAFTELGKVGYKIELSQAIIEKDYEKDPTLRPTLQYWLDKVFPNEKDKNGKITKWLTPWCYEIRMDWSGYSDADARLSTEVYENNYVSSWKLKKVEKENEFGEKEEIEELVPSEAVSSAIKARIVECKESNKYNITQDLAEAFEVFCEYEYTTNQRGEFVKTYPTNPKENDLIWTGRKVIFYNKGIKLDDTFTLDYQKNLQTISVTSESSEIYSKMFVKPIESEHMTNGYITIADTSLNPTGEDYILNFDYMYANGAITDYQYSEVSKYETAMFGYNNRLRELSTQINDLTIQINNLEADLTSAENSIQSYREQLTTYQGKLEASVTNDTIEYTKERPYTGTYVESSDGTYYGVRLTSQGISVGSITGYTDYKCTKELFGPEELISVPNGIGIDDKKFYVLLDDYGYATQINIPIGIINKTETVSSIYLTYAYSPENKYEAIVEKTTAQIEQMENKYDTIQAQINELKIQLEGNEETKEEDEEVVKGKQKEYDEILKEKQSTITRFERLMGPALQEGYWSPDAYEDAGETISGKVGQINNVRKIFTDWIFEGESKNYYYASITDLENDTKTYYPYFRLDDSIVSAIKGRESEVCVKMTAPNYTYTTRLEKGIDGYGFVILDGVKYYTTSSFKVAKDETLSLVIKKGEIKLGPLEKEVSTSITPKDEVEYFNCTSLFEGIGSYLSTRSLFPNAGFEYGYILTKDDNENEVYETILLLSDLSIPYDKYSTFALYVSDSEIDNTILYNAYGNDWTNLTFIYPRIELDYININSDADSFQVSYSNPGQEEIPIIKYEDYSVLTRGLLTYINLKTTNSNPIAAILGKAGESSYDYSVNFQVSRANDMLYLDAKQVAKDNSQPKLSYSLSIANTPDSVKKVSLGQLVFINDYSVDVHRAPGYVSGMVLKLDSPKEDELTISNYKTKFEDLFSTITASSEAMKNNKRSYDIASSAFVGGQLSGSILQQALVNNNISLSFSKTNVNMTDGDGIVLTNTTPYTNGVYGQVVLRGGGIYCSSELDNAGNRIWNSAITPRGINANYITAGQLDTNLIRIYSGNNMAFQWNEEGLYAYRREEDSGATDLSTYVKYSQDGLQYIQGDYAVVDLGWNGLNISTQEGALQLNGARGLTMYNGEGNVVLHLGRMGKEPNALYGLTLYDGSSKDIGNAPKTFYSTNEGNLWLKKNLFVGVDGVEGSCSGISGVVTEENDIRIWAGAKNNADPESAPFRVYEDGSFYATKGEISGLIIEGLDVYSTELASGDGFSINSANATSAIYLKFYLGGKQSEVPEGVKYTWYKTKLAYTSQPDDPLKDLSIWEVLDTGTENLCILNNIQENYWYCGVVSNGLVDKNGNSYKTASTPVKFAIVNDGKSASAVAIESSAAIIQRTLTSGTSPTQIEFRVRKGANYLPLEYGNNFTLFNNYLISTTQEDEETITETVRSEAISEDNVILSFEPSDPTTGILFLNFIDENGKDHGYGSKDMYSNVVGIKAQYIDEVNNAFVELSIPITVDNALLSLAKVQEGKVVVQDGTVYAGALVGEVVTAENIFAGAISTDKLASNRLESLSPSPNNYKENAGQSENPIFIPVKEYTETGGYIDFTNGGSIHFTNFYVDSVSGDAGFKGTIYAKAGAITGELLIGSEANGEYIKLNGSETAPYAIDSTYFKVASNGRVTATGGTIANWIIGQDRLYTETKNASSEVISEVGLYSGNYYTYGLENNKSPIRFYAGGFLNNKNTPNFLVTENGYLYAQNAEIHGKIIAESGNIVGDLYVGDNNNGILISGTDDCISSIPYTSGISGWKIDKNGNAELNNATIRGTLQSVVFEVNTVSAIGGDLYIAPTINIPTEDGHVDNLKYDEKTKTYTILINNVKEEIKKEDDTTTKVVYATREKWDKAIVILNMNIVLTEHKKYDDIRGTIVFDSEDTKNNDTFTIVISGESFNEGNSANSTQEEGSLNNAVFEYELTIIKLGQNDSYKYIYLTANHQEGLATPYIDVQDYVNEQSNSSRPRVRIGNLAGINLDANTFGSSTTLEGYGLYSDRAYLTGLLALPNAGVTNQNAIGYTGGESYIAASSSAGSAIRIWAGSSMPTTGGQVAPFIVTQDGYLYAKQGIFQGTVIAKNGEFSGIIRTAGVVIDDNGKGTNPIKGTDHFFVGYKENPSTFDDYVLDISDAGLRIWEGGFNVYSDTLSDNFYSYKNRTDPYPYISAIDEGRLAIKDINIMSPTIIDKGDESTEVGKFSSIHTKNGKLYFTSMEKDYTLEASTSYSWQESQWYASTNGGYIYNNEDNNLALVSQDNQHSIILSNSYISVKSPVLKIVTEEDSKAPISLFLNNASIVEIKNGAETIGLNFII